MAGAEDIEVVVFDILGTMVDEPGGLRAAIREALSASHAASAAAPPCTPPGTSAEAYAEQLLSVWRDHVEREEHRIGTGRRTYANTETIDHEAAQCVADRAGLTDPDAVARLARAGQRLEPWSDSAAGLARIAQRFPVLGLSNASRATLLRLHAYAGLRWHQALSAEAARAYKPAPQVYQLALEAAGCPPERVLMVAAHAWDLRGAQARGMRTAYVQRPGGDPPKSTDAFDWWSTSLQELATLLTAA